jgi:hypothetical protein
MDIRQESVRHSEALDAITRWVGAEEGREEEAEGWWGWGEVEGVMDGGRRMG